MNLLEQNMPYFIFTQIQLPNASSHFGNKISILNIEFLFGDTFFCPNVSTTPITAIRCRQCLPLSVVQLKGKNCRKPHSPCWSAIDFWKIYFKKWSLTKSIFGLFQTWIFKATPKCNERSDPLWKFCGDYNSSLN